ncbi:hypothetical protein BDZ89DRAFT_1071642 [Hymenopellis radicata]|nr:hypothetical protein BDZ89DRAFT_1071642 [Hymenopellis radicata]
MQLDENLSAHVIIDGTPADEFGVTISETGRNATCWIPSETGKAFSIELEDEPIRETSYDLKIDGRSYPGKVARKDRLGAKWHCNMQGRVISATEICPFVFSAIDSTDDDSLLGQSLGTELGDIVVTVYEAILTRRLRTYKKKPNSGSTVVHERLKKGVDHQTILGDSKHFSASRHTYHADPIGEPFTFCFKYRPLAVLQANGIAPRPKPRTSPAASAHLNPRADVDTEEKLRKLKARRRELELQRIEDEIRELEGAHRHDHSGGRVKRESDSTAVEGSSRKKVKHAMPPVCLYTLSRLIRITL